MMTLNSRLCLAFILVFILTILPLPQPVMGFRPPWILLVVLYIQFYLPNYFNMTVLFILGLCIDVLLSTVIGEHAFALVLTTWFAAGKCRRINFFSIVQQMMLLMALCVIYQLVVFLIEAFCGYHNNPWTMTGAALFSMMLWPWMRILGDTTLLMRRA